MNQIKVSKQFSQDFVKVSEFYNLAELGELETAKTVARFDLENAEKSYRAMAIEIESGKLKKG